MSKGKDVEALFPYVVKNVVCKTLEVKKLVYIYLIHYAEKQQDSALLAVNHFQKDLSDKNQFIRALALRVMSSMSVSLITQIIVMAIKKCCSDMSPYVRKAAALAIPKAFHLDVSLKQELQKLISQLLNDNNTMVLGAAVFAFQEICPDDFELIHPHYRKLCKYLVDCDEWGQVVILAMLLRYARCQFVSPFRGEAFRKKAFYSDSEDEDDWEDKKGSLSKIDDNINPVTEDLDQDHRLLLDGAKPLLRTRNASVVLAVVSLFYHAAPIEEHNIIVPALLRLIRGSRENQYVVLCNIATIAKEHPELLNKHLKDFYIYNADPIFIKNLKLEILSVLSNDQNIQQILQEFKSYVRFSQKEFVARTIDAICRVATEIPDVCESCIHILLKLLKSHSESVVGQAIIAIRHLLQQNPKERSKIIRTMATLVEAIKVPEAKANIIWIIGEYYDDISEMAPDALRILARSFTGEAPTVKLQTINLAAKLYMQQGENIEKLFQYILQLGKYDQDYDIRDRVRMIRTILFSNTKLKDYREKLFITEKIKPSAESAFHERSRFALASLSHLVNHSAEGYEALPDFPEAQPDTRKFRITVEELKGPDTKEINENESISSGRVGGEDFYGGMSDTDEDAFNDGDGGWSTDSSYTGSSYTGSDADEEAPPKKPAAGAETMDQFYDSDTGSSYSGSSYTGSETGSYTGSETGSAYSTGSESPRESKKKSAASAKPKQDTLIDFS